jgi:magnesium-transporting ATPase (P-type)
MITVSGIKVDQSMLTGESEPVALRNKMTSENYLESKNMTFCGGCVVDGSGVGLVVATGNKTVMGSLAMHAAKDTKKETYLAKEIRRSIFIIASLCIITALACFIAFVAWLRVKHVGFISWSGIVGIILGLMIAFLPEGVPLCVMATLFIVAKRMARANVLVKDLTIIETLGSINMIASDKTGTLTQNKMSVVEIVLSNHAVYQAPGGFHKAFKTHPTLFHEFVQLSTHCNGFVEGPVGDLMQKLSFHLVAVYPLTYCMLTYCLLVFLLAELPSILPTRSMEGLQSIEPSLEAPLTPPSSDSSLTTLTMLMRNAPTCHRSFRSPSTARTST